MPGEKRPSSQWTWWACGWSFRPISRSSSSRESDGSRYLPIWIGGLGGHCDCHRTGRCRPASTSHPRPDALGDRRPRRPGGAWSSPRRDSVFYADLSLDISGRGTPSRRGPRTPIALAVRTGTPVFAFPAVLDDAGVVFEGRRKNEEEEVARFREFLEEATIEDFLGGGQEPPTDLFPQVYPQIALTRVPTGLACSQRRSYTVVTRRTYHDPRAGTGLPPPSMQAGRHHLPAVDYWARTNLIRPQLQQATGSGSQRLYSFSDVVQLKVIKRLLDAGMSLRRSVGRHHLGGAAGFRASWPM